MFKQLLQAEAPDAVQLDACRLASVNEILAVLLMSAKFGIPVVPHSGGAEMVELCSHISTIDYVAVSGKKSILEYTGHLHDAFEAPATIMEGGMGEHRPFLVIHVMSKNQKSRNLNVQREISGKLSRGREC